LLLRQERWCIILLVEHFLKQVEVQTDGIRQAILQLKQRDTPGLVDDGGFDGIIAVSWPLDFATYFRSPPPARSDMLTDACDSALRALARKRGWNLTAVAKVFTSVRDADYRLEVERAKRCRSPDGTKSARVTYSVDRDEFTVCVEIAGPKKQPLLREIVYRDRPSAAAYVDRALKKPFWKSETQLIIPFENPNIKKQRLVIKVPG
jgi:hypothetical protein